ncbi:hypothetical protein ACHAXS_002650 [Conticribra weissflogii]
MTSENNTHGNPPCTCGPHPRIDITAPYLHYHGARRGRVASDDGDNGFGAGDGDSRDRILQAIIVKTREQIQNACRSHGCFHVMIRTPSKSDPVISGPDFFGGDNSAVTPLPIECLAKERTDIERDIEKIFSPSFLCNAVSRSSHAQKQDLVDDYCTDRNSMEPTHHSKSSRENVRYSDICNGSLLEVQFPDRSITRETYATRTSTNTKTATFRGRTAESGNEKEPLPEPKLSWEFRRCSGGVASGGRGGNVTPSEESSRKEGNGLDNAWNHLPSWINALHSIASVIVDQLEIPPRLVLQEEVCECDKRSEPPKAMNATVRKTKEGAECLDTLCNIDLLRVFRYDALPSSMSATSLGSSAHSDWGTLTVVWQDDKGGLQTYCRACDKWSDVDASPSVESGVFESTSSVNSENEMNEKTTGKDSEKDAVHAFVHVGDFLSLATLNHSGDSNSMPLWHSPRHRVQCPIRQRDHDQMSDAGDECRRSLVYFAYPPPGVSLSDAQRVVAPLACGSGPGRTDTTTLCDNSASSFYPHYSLLRNQAQKSPVTAECDEIRNVNGDVIYEKFDQEERAAYKMYKKIRNMSFHKAIFEKWGQVQRK